MDFSEQYLLYKEYEELNGLLEEVPFNLLEYDARKTLDERTQGRLTKLDNIPYEVKMCVFKMIGIEEKYQSLEAQNKAIVSENTDGYSVSYRKLEKSDIDTKKQELETAMRKYLSKLEVNGIPVLYLGVTSW